jgi:hypothetical protein
MACFSAGAATILLALSYGARGLITRRQSALQALMPYAQPILGVGLIAVGVFTVFHLDRVVEGAVLAHLPAWLQDLSVSL